MLWMWSAVVLVSALSTAAGYVLVDPAGRATAALVQAIAGGALLAMLAETLLPEAYKVEGMWTGSLVVAGSRSPWRCRRSSKWRASSISRCDERDTGEACWRSAPSCPCW
jgi:hypothetical protein